MNTLRYLIGIDIGTTSTKTILFTEQGDVIKKSSQDYPLYSPILGAAEQDPEEIFSAVITTVRQVIEESNIQPSQVLCLSFSAAMHSLVAVDSQGKPLTKSITWADQRSEKWAEKILTEYLGHDIYLKTGTPIHPMSPFVKITWLRHELPEIFAKAAKFISIKEYIFYKLFGEYIVDYSIAATTGLLNLKTLSWEKDALEIAGISENQLSKIVSTTYIFKSMKQEFASAMGISADVPTVIGASDGVLSNLGVGAIASGTVAVTVGTSGAIRAVVNKRTIDPQARLFCYPLTENYWIVGGAVNNGGIALRWVRDHLADTEVATAKLLEQDPYEIITAIAKTVAPGAEGLIFHPYLAGERAPFWDANARGSFFGLSLHHTKAHIMRAILEGVVYNLYLVLQALEDVIGEAKSIRATGGFARSPLWRQMLADVFNREIIVPESYESSCFGAAILGLYALKKIPSLDVVSQMIGETQRHQPNPENVKTYQKIIPIYSRLLESFKGEYANIASLQSELIEQ